jgi:hypothetical protein
MMFLEAETHEMALEWGEETANIILFPLVFFHFHELQHSHKPLSSCLALNPPQKSHKPLKENILAFLLLYPMTFLPIVGTTFYHKHDNYY